MTRISARTGLEVIDAVIYDTPQGGTVTLTPAAGGWSVTDTNTDTTTTFPSIPAFMRWCCENYTWPMRMTTS